MSEATGAAAVPGAVQPVEGPPALPQSSTPLASTPPAPSPPPPLPPRHPSVPANPREEAHRPWLEGGLSAALATAGHAVPGKRASSRYRCSVMGGRWRVYDAGLWGTHVTYFVDTQDGLRTLHPPPDVAAAAVAALAVLGSHPLANTTAEGGHASEEAGHETSPSLATHTDLGILDAPPTSASPSESYEGLGPDYGSNWPWVPPSRRLALRHRSAAVWGGGRASVLLGTDTPGDFDLAQAGPGLALYFRTLRLFGCLMLLLALASLPAFVLNYAGVRVPGRLPDPLGFSRLSLGNLGPVDADAADQRYRQFAAAEEAATSSSGGAGNTTSATVTARAGQGYSTWLAGLLYYRLSWHTLLFDLEAPLDGVDVANLLGYVDVAAYVAVLLAFGWAALRMRRFVAQAQAQTVSASSFTVLVQGLPGDASVEELRDHFSSLFALDGSGVNTVGLLTPHAVIDGAEAAAKSSSSSSSEGGAAGAWAAPSPCQPAAVPAVCGPPAEDGLVPVPGLKESSDVPNPAPRGGRVKLGGAASALLRVAASYEDEELAAFRAARAAAGDESEDEQVEAGGEEEDDTPEEGDHKEEDGSDSGPIVVTPPQDADGSTVAMPAAEGGGAPPPRIRRCKDGALHQLGQLLASAPSPPSSIELPASVAAAAQSGAGLWVHRAAADTRTRLGAGILTDADRDVLGAASYADRLAVMAGAARVTDVSHNGDPRFLGSWVADVAMVGSDVHRLRSYLKAQSLIPRLQRARAQVKQFSDDTPAPLGSPNAKKRAKAAKAVAKLEAALVKLQAAALRSGSGGVAPAAAPASGDASKGEGASAAPSPPPACIGAAFVTFNNEESYQRCLRAYTNGGASSSWAWVRDLRQPYYLRLRSALAPGARGAHAALAGGGDLPTAAAALHAFPVPSKLSWWLCGCEARGASRVHRGLTRLLTPDAAAAVRAGKLPHALSCTADARGWALRVSPAPDPSDLLYENLGVSSCERAARQAVSGLAALLLLLAAFVILVTANSSAKALAAKVPVFDLCEAEIPALYFGSYAAAAAARRAAGAGYGTLQAPPDALADAVVLQTLQALEGTAAEGNTTATAEAIAASVKDALVALGGSVSFSGSSSSSGSVSFDAAAAAASFSTLGSKAASLGGASYAALQSALFEGPAINDEAASAALLDEAKLRGLRKPPVPQLITDAEEEASAARDAVATRGGDAAVASLHSSFPPLRFGRAYNRRGPLTSLLYRAAKRLAAAEDAACAVFPAPGGEQRYALAYRYDWSDVPVALRDEESGPFAPGLAFNASDAGAVAALATAQAANASLASYSAQAGLADAFFTGAALPYSAGGCSAAARAAVASSSAAVQPPSASGPVPWFDTPYPGALDPGCPDPRLTALAAAAATGAGSGVPPPPAPHCPCVAPSSSATCYTLPCFKLDLQDPPARAQCRAFPQSTLAGCHCLTTLNEHTAAAGSILGFARFVAQEADVCLPLIQSYLAMQGLLVTSSLTAAVVNVLLMTLLPRLVAWERHISLSGLAKAQVVKVAAAQTVNTAVTSVLVQARPPNGLAMPAFFTTLGIFGGREDDFNTSWYASVGSALATTLLINLFTVPLLRALPYLLSLVKRRKAFKTVKVPLGSPGAETVIARAGAAPVEVSVESGGKRTAALRACGRRCGRGVRRIACLPARLLCPSLAASTSETQRAEEGGTRVTRRYYAVTATSLPTQADANALFVGPVFTTVTRYPPVILYLFVPMLYGSGLPLLYCIAAAFFGVCYAVDRWLLLRWNARPGRLDASLAVYVLKLLPLAVLFHCAVGIWIYSGGRILPAPIVSDSLVEVLVGAAASVAAAAAGSSGGAGGAAGNATLAATNTTSNSTSSSSGSGGGSSSSLGTVIGGALVSTATTVADTLADAAVAAYDALLRLVAQYDVISAAPRALRTNTFPLLCLLVILLLALVLGGTLRYLAAAVIRGAHALTCGFRCCRGRGRAPSHLDPKYRNRYLAAQAAAAAAKKRGGGRGGGAASPSPRPASLKKGFSLHSFRLPRRIAGGAGGGGGGGAGGFSRFFSTRALEGDGSGALASQRGDGALSAPFPVIGGLRLPRSQAGPICDALAALGIDPAQLAAARKSVTSNRLFFGGKPMPAGRLSVAITSASSGDARLSGRRDSNGAAASPPGALWRQTLAAHAQPPSEAGSSSSTGGPSPASVAAIPTGGKAFAVPFLVALATVLKQLPVEGLSLLKAVLRSQGLGSSKAAALVSRLRLSNAAAGAGESDAGTGADDDAASSSSLPQLELAGVPGGPDGCTPSSLALLPRATRAAAALLPARRRALILQASALRWIRIFRELGGRGGPGGAIPPHALPDGKTAGTGVGLAPFTAEFSKLLDAAALPPVAGPAAAAAAGVGLPALGPDAQRAGWRLQLLHPDTWTDALASSAGTDYRLLLATGLHPHGAPVARGLLPAITARVKQVLFGGGSGSSSSSSLSVVSAPGGWLHHEGSPPPAAATAPSPTPAPAPASRWGASRFLSAFVSRAALPEASDATAAAPASSCGGARRARPSQVVPLTAVAEEGSSASKGGGDDDEDDEEGEVEAVVAVGEGDGAVDAALALASRRSVAQSSSRGGSVRLSTGRGGVASLNTALLASASPASPSSSSAAAAPAAAASPHHPYTPAALQRGILVLRRFETPDTKASTDAIANAAVVAIGGSARALVGAPPPAAAVPPPPSPAGTTAPAAPRALRTWEAIALASGVWGYHYQRIDKYRVAMLAAAEAVSHPPPPPAAAAPPAAGGKSANAAPTA